ncbi:MAG: cold shock domain-containing protein [Candidatus Acidiferrales bacterium]
MNTRSGRVVFFNEARGYGFIHEITRDASERNPQHYFHVSNVTQQLSLKAGDFVYFQIAESTHHKGKYQAIDVRLTTANSYTPSGALTLDEIKAIDGGAK